MTTQRYTANPVGRAMSPETAFYAPAPIFIGNTRLAMVKSEAGEPVTGYDCVRRVPADADGKSWFRPVPTGTPQIGNPLTVAYPKDVREPRCFYDGSRLHAMVHSSDSAVAQHRTFYVYSDDLGLTWTLPSPSPILDSSDFVSWPGGSPSYVEVSWRAVIGGVYWAWGSTVNRLWYSKGTSWSDAKSITPPTAMLSPPSGSDEIWYVRPFRRPGGGYGMLTTCQRTGTASWRTDLWTSSDLTSWTINSQDVLPSGSGVWDAGNMYGATLVMANDGEWLTPQEPEAGYWYFLYSGGPSPAGSLPVSVGLGRTPSASPFGL